MWLNETVAEIHELLQNLLYVQSEGNAAKPQKKTRPGFMFDPAPDAPVSDGDDEVIEGLIPDEYFTDGG
ncbi:hypothetical protein [Streptomyces sp. NPDC057686]|uniref:hypothetical protein n=1 Tax=Streptomyces sp. NPDC057686 TaxID=3346212 RepID=UPI00367F069A